MGLTRDFRETIRERVQRDPAFRAALLAEGIECLLTGDLDTGRAVLRDYINATMGFQELGSLTDKSPKSLMRMFGPAGNPQAFNLFDVIELLQKHEGVHLTAHAVRQAPEHETLSESLIDDFSRQVLASALQVARDEHNPIRLNLFAAAVRELFGYTLDTLAPDTNVKNCSWYRQESKTKKPTRRQRAKYVTQGGLSDSFVAEVGVDVNHLNDDLIPAIDYLSKYTHIRPGVIVTENAKVEAFVNEALAALEGLFTSIKRCREQVLLAVDSHIDRELVEAFVWETLPEIDELATHHTIEDVYIKNLTIAGVDHRLVSFRIEGSLEVELQWGSGSDYRRGNGAKFSNSFPFTATMSSPVEEVTAFSNLHHTINTGDWYGDS